MLLEKIKKNIYFYFPNEISKRYILCLSLLFFFSLLIRLFGIDWDNGFLFHPDERAIFMHAYDINFSSLKHPNELFSANSSLNPHWFNYGTLPIYILKIVKNFIDIFDNLSIYEMRIPARLISMLIDSSTVILITYLSRAKLGNLWSLCVGFIVSISVIHIQNSHFYTTDVFITNFVILTLIFSIKNSYNPTKNKTLILALIFAAGLAFKFSFMPALVPILLSFLIPFYKKRIKILDLLKYILIFVFYSLIFLFIFQPYSFIDYNTYFSHISEQSKMVRGVLDFPYTRQYLETTKYIYPLSQLFTWGTGPVLGIFSILGLIFATFKLLKERDNFHILIFSWFITYLLINGFFQVKFLRYFLPLTPIIIFYAIYFLKFFQQIITNRFKFSKIFNFFLLILFIVPTLHFSFAYIYGIYLKDHTAVNASNWLKINAKNNEIIIQEHWEESLPNLDHIKISNNRLEMYNPDTLSKFDQILNNLNEADYYVIFSNRLYGTIPRLQERYPISTVFYEKLFEESLGYTIIHYEKKSMNLFNINYEEDFFSRIKIKQPELIDNYEEKFLINLNLGWADESFSVYDHPQIIIFKNEKKYSKEKLSEIINLDNLANDLIADDYIPLSKYKKYEKSLKNKNSNLYTDHFYMKEKSLHQQILLWFFVINLLGYLTFPILYRIFRNLPDLGYSLSKFMGLFLFSWIVWILISNSSIDFSFEILIIVLSIFFFISLCFFYFSRSSILFHLRKNYQKILLIEFIFYLMFFVALYVRYLNPDLWHPFRGGEKPMDLAYLNALIRSMDLPPFDPWFSGFTLNYYYFGQYMVSVLIKLSGVPTNIAYNLAIPTFFSYTSILIFGLISNITFLVYKLRDLNFNWFKYPLLFGIFGIFITIIFGNFDGFLQLINLILGRQNTFDYWGSTRIVSMVSSGLEITEFPFFTFLFADLHAHLLSLPILLSILFFAFVFYYEYFANSSKVKNIILLTLLGLLVGGIRATNTWDYPVSLVIVFSSIFFAIFFAYKDLRNKITPFIMYCLVFFISSKLFFYNFENNLIMPNINFEISKWRTPFYLFLEIYFFPILVILIYSCVYIYKLFYKLNFLYEFNYKKITYKSLIFSSLLLVAYFAFFYDFLFNTLLFLFLLISIISVISIAKYYLFEAYFKIFLWLAILIVLGLAIPLLTELVVLGGDINRMNTIFKFYFESWIILNIAISIIIPIIFIEHLSSFKSKIAFFSVLSSISVIALIYPILAIGVRVSDRFSNNTHGLDGMKFMKNNVYYINDQPIDLNESYMAINWLNQNISGNPNIVEASGNLYSWTSRISIYTGLPTVLGWDWHQKQQRSLEVNSIAKRKNDIDTFYNTLSDEYMIDFLDYYGIELIILGPLEKTLYENKGLMKFNNLNNKFVDIYNEDNFRIIRYLGVDDE